MGPLLDRFDFHLPRTRIAQRPAHPRDASRLLVLDRSQSRLLPACRRGRHRRFRDLPTLLQPGDLLVVNDTRVFPARLIGRRETGGRIEVFLLREIRPGVWEVLLGGKVRRVGVRIILPGGLTAQVLRRHPDRTWQVRFSQSGSAFWRAVEYYGQTPT
ncbi:MAG: S-adenosylmethionine:tRNA ribosyltransferase-isomerase, partial [Candidatus Kerfeldbacteria bacterium]|nr:S-adenosylmethionine:tRNA ribosyltransferase-isomerase [Candidatus Kerfeldbacteria bacterium]